MITTNNSGLIDVCSTGLWSYAPSFTMGLQSKLELYTKASMEDRIKATQLLESSNNIVEQKRYVVEGTVLVYPIVGQLVPRTDAFMEYLGFISTLDLIADLESIEIPDNIKTIVFYVVGPGGALVGIPELANLINQIQIPTVTFVDDMMLSAHYYVGSASDKIISTSSALVGNIGTIKEVVKFNNSFSDTYLFYKGEYKAAGHPAKSLDLKEMKFFDEMGQIAYDQMVTDIAKYRGKPEQEVRDTEGAYMQASMNEWYVDGMVNSLGELIHSLNS